MEPKVSIIIPVYNGEDCISIPLDSILEQTFTNFEVVIIDDGSIDNTSELIRVYTAKDSRIKYKYQHNQGVAVARNNGLKIATGSYVCFLDSDDYYDKTFLQKLYRTIIKTNTEVCYCGYKTVTPHCTENKKSGFRKGDILKDYILNRISIASMCWMIKRDLLISHNIIFPVGVSWGEDFEFFCWILAVTNQVSYVDEYLTNYRIDFAEDRLSAFAIDKIDKDYESIKRIQMNKIINKNTIISSALIDYRLSGRVVYRLIEAFEYDVEKKVILRYFERYRKYILRFGFNNGLRSIKLNMNRLKLLYCVKQI